MVVGLLVLLNPGYYLFDSPLDYVLGVVEGLALLAILGGLAGLHLAQKGHYGRLGGIGFFMSAAGLVMAGIGHLVGLPFFVFIGTGGIAYVLIGLSQGVPLAWGAIYSLGAVLMSAGFVLFGVSTVRARTLPLWCGPALVAGLAGLWSLGNVLGWLSFGLAWILVWKALRGSGYPGKRSPARTSRVK